MDREIRQLGWGALALVTLALSACGPRPAASEPTPVAPDQTFTSGKPPWDLRYTKAQEAMLAPGDAPITIPVPRTFPDLERFTYAANRPLRDPSDALRFLQMVAKVLEESPRMYIFSTVEPDLANPIAQYGPPGPEEADAWYVRRFTDDGAAYLAAAPLAEASRTAYAEGRAAYESGDLDKAEASFKVAIEQSPDVPALALAIAEVTAARAASTGGVAEEALPPSPAAPPTGGEPSGKPKAGGAPPGTPTDVELAFHEALEVDPSYASTHQSLARYYLKQGNLERARRELAEALAYHPRSKQSWALAAELIPDIAPDRETSLRPLPAAIFLDVDAAGAIRVGAASRTVDQMYGGCRAVVRYEPDVRAALLGTTAEEPYHLSTAEEVICLETAIGAYLFDLSDKSSEGQVPDPDPRMESLLTIAQRDGLSGYAMFEIIGRHRPERARTAPDDVHAEMVRYIMTYVLGAEGDLPPGQYSAQARR